MIKVKILNTPELIEDACALLYEVYIEECSWKFKIDNPSQLRIEVKNNRKLLKDRFTDYATWFGAFDEDELIGCGRLCGVDKQNKLEVEKYKSSKVINKYLPQNKDYCFEITRVAVRKKYAGRGAVKRLFLALFKYCEANHCSIIACTFNGYLKYLFKKIEFPLLIENAFKYETHDLNPVNFYFAEYEKSEIKYMIKFLEALFNDKCNKINSKIFKALEIVAPVLPIPLYWHDDNGVVVGINEHALKGIDNSSDIIGKTPYEFYPKEIAEHILTHNMQVMLSGETLSQEEYIEDVSTKQKKYFSSVKSPLYDEDDKVIGIVGSFIDITSEKEAQRLALENEAHKIENERHKTIVEEQEKFRKIVGQMVHDIQSPLASLRTIVESAINVPENDRITLRNAAMSITDITTHMLNKYKNNCNTQSEQRQPLLLSAELLKILSEKRYEYKNLAIEFISDFHKNAKFSFINIEPSSFKRMISNVINNSIDALENRNNGKVTIKLNMTVEWAIVSIEDNGCGMSEELIDKITNNFRVTDKKNGHGIGLSQIRDTLENNYGKLLINSTVGEGTKVILMFPKIPVPSWIAEEINIFEDDIVVIVDDEISIHGAWDARFSTVLKETPTIKVKHFLNAADAVDFINSQDNKRRICLLTDYELLNQKLNGLELINRTQIKRAILVTSYYDKLEIREKAAKFSIKILPKSLNFAVPIYFKDNKIIENKNVDMVWVDDAQEFIDGFIEKYYKHLSIDTYYDPNLFLDNFYHYPLNTKIVLDMFYYNDITFINDGLTIAKELHKVGYNNLYLTTAEMIPQDKIPDYLTVIQKNHFKHMSNLDKLQK